jgi:tRNA/rRNA methyltransferase
MTTEATLSRCRVVLVEPQIPGNVGAIARVMRNMGLSDLVLVNPGIDPQDPLARQQATHGEEILARARMTSDFGEAVGDCVLVAGTSARTGGLFRRQNVAFPEVIMPALVEALAAGRHVALVFGTESHGLTNDQVARCHHLIHIPANPEYPTLNLSQAAAICLYELRRAWLGGRSKEVRDALAPFAEQEHMFAQLRAALEEIHFLFGPKADALMHGLRHLLGRAGLTRMDVDLLRGLARQIRWQTRQGKQ